MNSNLIYSERRLRANGRCNEKIENRDNETSTALFEASPIPEEQRRAGFGGVNRYKKLEGFGNSDQIIETTKQIDILSRTNCCTIQIS